MPLTLVFADDDDLVRLVVNEALREAGVEVHAVPDGMTAVERCRELKPQTVLLDLDMPHMDGFEAARRIRQADCTGRLVALTGRATEDCFRRAETAGFDEILSKPISALKLMHALFPDAETEETLGEENADRAD